MPSLPPSNKQTSTQKSEQRKLWRQVRREISEQDRAAAGARICLALERHQCFHNATHVAGYLPLNFEANVQPLLNLAHNMGKKVWIPRVAEQQMAFAAYQPSGDFEQSTVGTFQPYATAATCLPQELDVVLLPLLAFTRQGNRLGMGGGYYDRAFSFMLQRGANGRSGRGPGGGPVLVGVAFSHQEASNLPTDHWDVPLAHVVTEQQWINCA